MASTFRQIESTTLDKLLNERSAEVIALGGGAWIEDSNRMALQHAHAITVWLDTPLDMCWNRIVASSEDRPLGRTKEQATQLYELRYPVYALAQIRVAVSEEASPEGLAAYIETEIRKLGLEE